MSRNYASCVCKTVTAKPDGKCAVCGGYWQIPRTTEALTIREHFAAMAMQGLLSSAHKAVHEDLSWMANRAVICADFLIAELEKSK